MGLKLKKKKSSGIKEIVKLKDARKKLKKLKAELEKKEAAFIKKMKKEKAAKRRKKKIKELFEKISGIGKKQNKISKQLKKKKQKLEQALEKVKSGAGGKKKKKSSKKPAKTRKIKKAGAAAVVKTVAEKVPSVNPEKILKSVDLNVRKAIIHIRKLTNKEQLMEFVHGDERITIKRAVISRQNALQKQID